MKSDLQGFKLQFLHFEFPKLIKFSNSYDFRNYQKSKKFPEKKLQESDSQPNLDKLHSTLNQNLKYQNKNRGKKKKATNQNPFLRFFFRLFYY